MHWWSMRYSSSSVWMLYLNRRWFCDVFREVYRSMSSVTDWADYWYKPGYLFKILSDQVLPFIHNLLDEYCNDTIHFLKWHQPYSQGFTHMWLAWWILRDTIATYFDRIKNHLIIHGKSRELFRIAIKISASSLQFCDVTWSTHKRVALPGCFIPVESCSLHFTMNSCG